MLKRTYKHTYIDEDKNTHVHTRINANRHTHTHMHTWQMGHYDC